MSQTNQDCVGGVHCGLVVRVSRQDGKVISNVKQPCMLYWSTVIQFRGTQTCVWAHRPLPKRRRVREKAKVDKTAIFPFLLPSPSPKSHSHCLEEVFFDTSFASETDSEMQERLHLQRSSLNTKQTNNNNTNQGKSRCPLDSSQPLAFSARALDENIGFAKTYCLDVRYVLALVSRACACSSLSLFVMFASQACQAVSRSRKDGERKRRAQISIPPQCKARRTAIFSFFGTAVSLYGARLIMSGVPS